VARGLYRIPDQPVTEHHGLALAARSVPNGVVCLLSALGFHGIGSQLPFEVWIAIDRRTRAPAVLYTPAFAELPDKRSQWKAFLRKNSITGSQQELETVVGELARFLLPPLTAAAGETDFEAAWLPGGPWRP
jgi:hypothetical protein